MHLRFFIEPDGLLHIYGHGVHETEVEEIMSRPLENLPGGDGSRIIIGRTGAGRVLKIVCRPDDVGDGIFVVTAFDLRGKPLQAFKRRLRRQGLR